MFKTNGATCVHFFSLICSPSGHLSLLFIYMFNLFLAMPYDMWDLSSLIRDPACAPAVEAWSLNHRTTGETPLTFLLCVCVFQASLIVHLTQQKKKKRVP